MKKYEYKVIEFRNSLDMQEHFLNEHGDEGWELVSVTPAAFTGGTMIASKAYMKREIGSDQTNPFPINY